MSLFQKAVKNKEKARIALCGPSGSGKTYTALRLATELAGEKRVVVIDTEHGSASLYSDIFDFDTHRPTSFSPEDLPKLVEAAEAAGYSAFVVDSWSHYWNGEDGTLEQVEKRKNKPMHRGNSFATWNEVTPIFRRMIAAMKASRMHVIVTMRTKTEWVVEENDRGKKVPRKIGTAPEMRQGVDFEFDVVADMDNEKQPTMHIGKTRYPKWANKTFVMPGEEQARELLSWLDSGEERLIDFPKELREALDNETCAAAVRQHGGEGAKWNGLDNPTRHRVIDELRKVKVKREQSEDDVFEDQNPEEQYA